jgi:hypothetical protein
MASQFKPPLADGWKEALLAHLFPDREGSQTYAILDGASCPDLLEHLLGDGVEYVCLYRGELAPDVAEVAPYLCQLKPNTPFTDWLLDDGWGKHWGVFALTGADLAGLRRHLRQFLMVRGPEGNQLYFRYYDPRVLRAYLPTCNGEELETVFGPIEEILLEGKKPSDVMRFAVPGEALKAQTLSLLPPENGKPGATAAAATATAGRA